MEIRRLASDAWALSWAEWRAILTRTWSEAGCDNISLVAAGVAFYAVAAIVPLLAVVVLVYGLVADAATVTRNLQALMTVLPADAAHAIGDQLATVVRTSGGKKGLGLIVALALALYGATKGSGAMTTALNIAYGVHEKRGFIRLNLLALGMVVGAVLLVLLAIGVTTVAALLDDLMPGAPGIVRGLIRFGSYGVLGLLVIFGAALLYQIAPDHRPRPWTWLTPGAVSASLLWLGGTALFGVYTANLGNYGATYGSLATVIVLLTWLWLSAYLFLLGGELNSAIEGAKDKSAAAATAPPAAAGPAAAPPPAPAIAAPAPDSMIGTGMEAKLGGRLAGGRVKLPAALLAGAGLARLRRGSLEGLALVAGAAALAWLGRERGDRA